MEIIVSLNLADLGSYDKGDLLDFGPADSP
jgi:hypothetical protein